MGLKPFGLSLDRGEKTIKRVKVAEFGDGTPISLVVRAVRGINEGPLISMLGAQHGDEYNGIASINRLVDEINPEGLTGSVVAIPISNPPAFLADNCMAPPSMGYRKLDMDTVWPGNPNGLLTERIAAAIWKNAVTKSDYVLDFHDGGRIILCRYILAEYTEDTDRRVVNQIKQLYASFGQGVPVQLLVHSRRDPRMGVNLRAGSLNTQAGLMGIPSIMAEMGGGLRIWEEHVQTAVQGAKNVMISLGMVQEEPKGTEKKQIVSTQSIQCRAKHGGFLCNRCGLNDVVRKGDKLGTIKDAAWRQVEEIYAKYDSVLTDIRYQPKVNSGDWLYWYGKIE